MNLSDKTSWVGTANQYSKSATVAIVGLCGGGSHVYQQLGHVGIGSVLLVDHDTVDDTNHNRMVGLTAKDIENKALKTDIT